MTWMTMLYYHIWTYITLDSTPWKANYDDVDEDEMVDIKPSCFVIRIEDDFELDLTNGNEMRECDMRHSLVQIRVTGEGIMGRMKNKEAEEVLKGNPEFPKKKDDWARDRAVAIQIVKRD